MTFAAAECFLQTALGPPDISITDVQIKHQYKIEFNEHKKNAKSFLSHRAHGVELISVSLALSRTPVYTARSRIRRQCIMRCACLCSSIRRYSLCLPKKGWPGWVDL